VIYGGRYDDEGKGGEGRERRGEAGAWGRHTVGLLNRSNSRCMNMTTRGRMKGDLQQGINLKDAKRRSGHATSYDASEGRPASK